MSLTKICQKDEEFCSSRCTFIKLMFISDIKFNLMEVSDI